MTPEMIEELIGDFDLDSLPEKASRSIELEWVHVNLGRQRPAMANCPSIAAWGEYIHAADKPKDFYDRYHKIVQEAVDEDRKKNNEHASEFSGVIDRILDFCKRSSAQVAGGEPPLPLGDFEAGVSEQDDETEPDGGLRE